MKKLIIFPLLVLSLTSCDKDDKVDLTQEVEAKRLLQDITQTQKWQLVKMTGQIRNSETTGANMPWQEFYLFHPDGSFTKFMQRGGVSTSASGIYTYHRTSTESYLELFYPDYSDLIGSCTSAEPKETLVVHKNGLQSSWWACDGPGLWYEKVD
ncbi:hypothetical protein PKOR_08755 [Pontibacter korlensis]|uniref:Lipoprotein n=1 Tax=Pontibacter korlensis TaxID=400092 RepID=A0A0E3UZ11_9BACT|nr:hypothetical protein PKOR_08755 [Pontibacter korlensis]